MAYSILDFIGDVSGWRPRALEAEELLGQCILDETECERQLAEYRDELQRLKLIVPRPAPPHLDYIVARDTLWIRSIIASLNLDIVRLPLGDKFLLTNQKNFINIVAWDWVDSLEYRDTFKCGNFTIAFKAHTELFFPINQVGIVLDYKAGHAYNLIVFPDGKVMLLEPQFDNLFCWTKRLKEFYRLEGATVII